MKKILITGADGRVGSSVARRLAHEQVSLRLHFRVLPRGQQPNCEVSSGDFNDPAQFAQAFRGIDAAFMYAPASSSAVIFRAAREAGVRHVVLLSSASVVKVPPGTNPVAERHRQAERAILDEDLDWTFIRPDTMASNALRWVPSIREHGFVRSPYPESSGTPLHEDDIAVIAAQSLAFAVHVGTALTITGPQCLSVRQQVGIIGEVIGKRVDCVEVSREEALRSMESGSPPISREVASRLLDYTQKSVTFKPVVMDEFEKATGLQPRSFREWVTDNASHFAIQAGDR